MDRPLLVRRVLPSFCLVVATFLGLARLPLVEWLPRMPAPLPIALFYWTLARPERVPVLLLFVLGLVLDAAGQAAIGTQSLLLIAFYGIGRWLRPSLGTLSLVKMWAAFAAWFAAYALALWAALGIALPSAPPLRPVASVWLFSCLAYPLLHWVFDLLLASSRRRRL